MTTHTLPLLHEDEQYVGIAGDFHGNTRWAVACIDAFASKGIKSIFQLGDFGIWPGQRGDEYLGKMRKALEEHDMKIYVTLGNHEDYDQVDAHEKDEQGIAWFRHNIAVLPRAYGFRHRDINFLSLGGAPSIDRNYRTQGHDWWPQEMLYGEDVDQAIEIANELGHVNVMLTHDAPDGGTTKVQNILDYNPQGWSREMLDYCAEGRLRMNRAVYGIKPDLLMHGHYHVFDYGYLQYGEGETPGQIISFNPDGCRYNVGILDVDNIYNVQVSGDKYGFDFKEITEL